MKTWLNSYRLKHPKHFLSRKEEVLLSARIIQFEDRTGCELVFHFRKELGEKPFERARELFYHFGLDKTEHHAAIIVVLSFTDRKYAVYVDENVVSKTEDNLWTQVGDAIAAKLKTGERLSALLTALDLAEKPLALNEPEKLKNQKHVLSNKPITEEE